MNNLQEKQNKGNGKRTEKRFAFFRPTEYKFYLVIAVAITFIFFIGSARSGTFFGMTLNVNTTLENGLVGHWTFDGKDTTLATTTDRVGGNDGSINGSSVIGGIKKYVFATAGTTTWTVPSEVVSITVKAWGGGGGGAGGGSVGLGGAGGGAGYAQGDVSVTAGERLDIFVGGKGGKGFFSTGAAGALSGDGGGGGGYSAVKRGSLELLLSPGGGGGGGGDNSSATAGGSGGVGGGLVGAGGSGSGSSTGGGGGTQSAGGSAGAGGTTASVGSSLAGGGGPSGNGASCNTGTIGNNNNGGTNGGAGGGIADESAGCAAGGGGAGGYFGGGGGGNSSPSNAGGSGGGGGSSYIISLASATTSTSGSGRLAANRGDADYVVGVGDGGVGGGTAGAGTDGGDGRLVISYTVASTTVLTTTPGRLGSALQFDGINDYVNIGATGQTVKTLAFWIKADSLTDDIIDLNGTADVTVSGGTISANSFTTPTIYVDGVVGSTIDTGWKHVVITTATGISASAMKIGLANAGYFKGAIDDVRIYNRVLSTTEITRLAELGMTTKIGTTIYSNPELENGLLGHWTLDGAGSTAPTTTDRVGANDGLIIGNTQTLTSTVTFENVYSVALQETSPRGVTFNNDGTKMYITGAAGDDINEYALAIPYDSASATFYQKSSISSHDNEPRDAVFNADGTKMFFVGQTNDRVYEFSLTTPFDISTKSFIQSFSVAAQDTTPNGLSFSTDGTKMYVVGNTGDDINQYTLTTGFDISTASYLQRYSVAAQDTIPSGVFFNDSGSKMFISGASSDSIHEYGLTTAYDISTASLATSMSIVTQDTNPRGGIFSKDGYKLYVVGDTGDDVNQYTLNNPFDLAGTFTETVSISTPGRLGSAMEFDGIDDYVDISGVAASIDETQGTISAWVYIDSASLDSVTDGIIEIGNTLSTSDLISMRLTSANGLRFRYVAAGAVTNATLVDATPYANQWVHAVGTWDGSNANIYINGVLEQGPKVQSGTIANGLLNQASIGADASLGIDQYFKGKIDDVRIYNRALSAGEIKRLAQLGMTTKIATSIKTNPATQTNLVGHWTFDGPKTTQSTSTDSAGSANGVLSGVAPTPGRLGSALQFDGINDYVNIGATGQTVKTLAFWIKADSLTDDIIDLNGTADVTVSAGTISANSFTSPTIYVDGVVGSTIDTDWKHVVITTTTGISASAMKIGLANVGYFKGKIDDVRIYSTTLTPSEVSRLYQTGN